MITLCLLQCLIVINSFAASSKIESDNYIKVNEWHTSVALGAGTITNPLNGGKNIPLFIIPYIAYYGENLFIENNTLGYSFYQNDFIVISAISQINREAMFFHDWQPTQLFVPNFSESIVETPNDKPVYLMDIQKRKWAIDGGIQINWFINNSLDIKAKVLHDLNQVYQGYNASIVLNKNLQFNALKNSQFNISVGANWQSAALANYYYGLDENDNVDLSNLYQAKSGIQPYISLAMIHKINVKWRLKLLAKQEFLDTNLSHSPLIKESSITSVFFGVVYAF